MATESRMDERESRQERAVLRRLSRVTLRRPAESLQVRARGGLARLSGRVESLWDRLKLAEHAQQAPEVERVVAEDVRVAPSGRGDGEIAAELLALLQGAASVDSRTLAVAVHDGVVTVLGRIGSREEQRRVAELVGLTPGVRAVNDRTSVEPEGRERDLALARDLQALVRQRFGDDVTVHVAVLEEAVVLRGEVRRHSVKLGIQRLVSDRAGRRVVNRIGIAIADPEPPDPE
jgi:osmotically-inducible protein OsmY